MKRLIALLFTLGCLLPLQAATALSDTAVYFLNIYPGPDIYELEGHSAIIVDIPGRPAAAYNFGVFDFDQPNFVYRFVKGETDYRAVRQALEPFLAYYARQGRRAVAHRLNFDGAQTARLVQLLEENVRPENAVYRYNYVKDNCATRPLRAVELAAGDTLQLAPAPFEAQPLTVPTFRNVMRHYHRNYPWYQFGIDLALGSGIDYQLTRREIAFAPTELDGMLANATAGGRPLVAESFPIINRGPEDAIMGATPWYLAPMFVCWLAFALVLWIVIRDLKHRRVTRWVDAAYFALMGVAGCLLTFLIFISVHEATSPNWLYAWLNPLCLVVPALIWIKSAKNVLFCYQIINFALLILLCVGWAFLPQSANPAFLPLILADLLLSGRYIYLRIDQTHKK